jgi:signal transduction histidine kinase
MSAGSQLAAPSADAALTGRSELAHLLHALNQPLTGLQCSMELAVSGPRSAEQYVRVLREGLELAARMRMLVEAIRELVDMQQNEPSAIEDFQLDTLLRETVDGLRPVAEERGVHLVTQYDGSLTVQTDRRWLELALFRLLESVLSLARDGSECHISAGHAASGVLLAVSWTGGTAPEHSPFSSAELGLLIAQASGQRIAEWETRRSGGVDTCTIRLPLVSPMQLQRR